MKVFGGRSPAKPHSGDEHSVGPDNRKPRQVDNLSSREKLGSNYPKRSN